jgi:predicted transcriptional regulator of viral defense system
VIEQIRKAINREEFDYQVITTCLKGYSYPRDKITDLLREGQIIRVKKGLYIFGSDYRRRPYSREILANLIYGPSYISLEFALSYHGLIPERVEILTSVTTGRSRTFTTTVGVFKYHMIPIPAFQSGMTRVELDDGGGFLIAAPEKSLVDKLFIDRSSGIRTLKGLEVYLFDDLRIDRDLFSKLNSSYISDYADRYRSSRLKLLSTLLRKHQRQESEEGHA